MYRTALNGEFNISLLAPVLLGLMFIFMGNYLPKIKPNRTLGIKISWTLSNEENWDRTHRFGGKGWVAGGVFMLLSVFLPIAIMKWFIACVIIAVAILPIIYSYSLYKQHKTSV